MGNTIGLGSEGCLFKALPPSLRRMIFRAFPPKEMA